jgi:hypothetical protein
MSIDAKVEVDGLHAGPLFFFFFWRMKVVLFNVGPFSLFLLVLQIFFWVVYKSLEWAHLEYIFSLFIFCS